MKVKILLTLVVVATAGALILLVTQENPTTPETQKEPSSKNNKQKTSTASINRPAYSENRATNVETVSSTLPTDASPKEIISGMQYLRGQKPAQRRKTLRDFDEYLNQLRTLGTEAIPEIREAIFNNFGDLYMRMKLVQVLGDIQSDRAVDLLTDIVNSKNMEKQVRVKAMDSISRSSSQKAFDLSKNLLETDPDFPGRYNLVKAIARSKDERAIPLLFNIIENDTDKESKYVAASRGLETFVESPLVREKLRHYATTNPDPIVRQNSILSLSKYKDNQTKAFLEDLLETEKDAKVLKTAKAVLSKMK